MSKRFILLLLISFVVHTVSASDALRSSLEKKYDNLEHPSKPSFEVYQKAVVGYLNLSAEGKLSDKNLLTIIDFSKSSNEKRIWVIDMKADKVVYHNLVSHGRNTGNEFARHFSNLPNSNKSSLGFYVTGENYYGKHGLSLRLDGVEKGYNDNARKRAIVMHGADYVDTSYTKAYGRIGRSLGCPAVPLDGHESLLRMIAEKTCLFIYYPDQNYLENSRLSDENSAYTFLSHQLNSNKV
jgi:hypothetical protein